MVQILPPTSKAEGPKPTSDPQKVTTVVLGSTLESIEEADGADTLPQAEEHVAAPQATDPQEVAAALPAETAPEPVASRGPSWLLLAGGGTLMFACGIGLAAWLQSGSNETSAALPTGAAETAAEQPAPLKVPADANDSPVVTADYEAAPAATSETEAPLEREPAQLEAATADTRVDDSDDTSPADDPSSDALATTPADSQAQSLDLSVDQPPRQVDPPADSPDIDDLALAAPPEFDPLDFDPTTIELVLTRGGSAADQEDASPPAAAEAGRPAGDEPAVALDEQLAAAGRREAVTVARGPSSDPRNNPPSAPADPLLAVVVPRIDLKDMPLVAAVDFFSELTGTPITLSPQALSRAGISPSSDVSFQATDAPIGSVLSEGIAPRRLQTETRGPHVIVTRVGYDEPRATIHRLSDLADDDPEALTELLAAVGPPAARGQAINESGQLQLDARRGEHFDLLILCERLRAARGVALQTKYPRRLASRGPALGGLWPTLSRRTTFSFVEPTPFREIVRHIERVTQWTVLVDWVSLTDGAAMGPRSTLTAATTNRPWREALDGLLTPLGLAWAPIDEQTIWIASQSQIDAEAPTDFYPTSQRLGRAAIERLIRQQPDADAFYDEPSRRLIVRGGADAHLQAWRAIGEAVAR